MTAEALRPHLRERAVELACRLGVDEAVRQTDTPAEAVARWLEEDRAAGYVPAVTRRARLTMPWAGFKTDTWVWLSDAEYERLRGVEGAEDEADRDRRFEAELARLAAEQERLDAEQAALDRASVESEQNDQRVMEIKDAAGLDAPQGTRHWADHHQAQVRRAEEALEAAQANAEKATDRLERAEALAAELQEAGHEPPFHEALAEAIARRDSTDVGDELAVLRGERVVRGTAQGRPGADPGADQPEERTIPGLPVPDLTVR